MISLMIGTAIALAGLQATIAAPRTAFVACLKEASAKAASQKVGGDAYDGFVRTACTNQATNLKGALVAFDVKNGVKRGQAASDANGMLDDYLATSIENYKARVPMDKPAPTPAAVAK
jgi:hypothetical protein